ncbi:hypothetical protein T492DRAFT_843451 [Pavlovales sp. CCMP2436]|nr:hypothetical protein T492DRAFT_843451 [Pavlovales sp. CCMP2436]
MPRSFAIWGAEIARRTLTPTCPSKLTHKPTQAPPLSEELKAHVARGATRHLHMSGIDHSVSYQMLEAEFGAYGEIESMRILPVKSTSAFVNFTGIASAIAAKEALNGVPFKNKTLVLDYYKSYNFRKVKSSVLRVRISIQ